MDSVVFGFGYLENEELARVYLGMDVHRSSTTFGWFDPSDGPDGRYRTVTRPTTAESIAAVLRPFEGECKVAYEVGTQAQWIASIVRPLTGEVQVNPSLIPWLFRAGRITMLGKMYRGTRVRRNRVKVTGATGGAWTPSAIKPALDNGSLMGARGSVL